MTTRRAFLRLLGIGAPAAAVALQLPETATAAPSDVNNAVRLGWTETLWTGHIEREDLTDIISRLEPVETEFGTMHYRPPQFDKRG